MTHQGPVCARLYTLAPRLARLGYALLALTLLLSACQPARPAGVLPPFDAVPAIWPHPAMPEGPEVALFRDEFTAPAGVESAELQIFADTRYEVWLDGQHLGRGPARFAPYYREYDRLPTGPLAPGLHTLAVLVQWAPNSRRSESQRPLLMARLLAETPAGRQNLATTGLRWEAIRSPAWQDDTALVDVRDLIGPTELLDLRRLPAGWNQPGYNAAAWPGAWRVFPPDSPAGQPSAFQPRSIPQLVDVPLPLTAGESGALGPGRRLVELPAGASRPWTYTFQAEKDVNFDLETLEENLPALRQLTIDGRILNWEPADPQRPQVWRATRRLRAGEHSLRLEQVPQEGGALSLSTRSLKLPKAALNATPNAGRRSLLAERSPAPGAVAVRQTADGLEIDFPPEPAYLVLDLGRTIHGRLALTAEGPPGSVLDIGWDERPRGDPPRLLPYPGAYYTGYNQLDSWTMDGSPRAITSIDARSGRYLLLATPAGGKLRLRGVQASEERYPATDLGYFRSSDPQLDHIWQIGLNTLLPNLTDAFTDTPWRERGQWWADTHIASRAAQAALGGSDPLLRRGLLLMANAIQSGSPAPGMVPHNGELHMLDYALLWAADLADYVARSGDLDTARQAYPALQRMLEHAASFELPGTGLIYLEQDHWSKTAYIDSTDGDNRYGASTSINALYVTALMRAAWLADQLGEHSQAAAWGARALQARSSANRLLYLPESGRYAATYYAGQRLPPSPQAQAYALAAGLPEDTERPRVTQALLELARPTGDRFALQMPGLNQALTGLARVGEIPAALLLLRQTYGRLADSGATTWWENFQATQSAQDSLSHAWGSTPTWLLTTQVLGARQTGPQTWEVSPAPSGLKWAEGALPLPQGLLQVRWQALPPDPRQPAGCSLYRITLSAPSGSAGRLLLPAEPTLLPPGVNAEQYQAGWIVLLGEGTHVVEAPLDCRTTLTR